MQLLFVPLISAVLHKKQAGNAGVSVAAMSMTWFFNQSVSSAVLPGFNRSIKISLSEYAAVYRCCKSASFLNSLVFVALQNSGFCPL